jgi:hypothetical protein
MRIRAYYKKLGITLEQVEALPKITKHLKKLMAEMPAKDMPDDIEYYLEACADPIALKVKQKRALLNYNQKKRISLEELCAAAEVSPHDLQSAIMDAIHRLFRYDATFRLSSAQTDVADKTVNMALTDEGFKDREMYMKIVGLMPQPKGAQTLINVTQNQRTTPQVVVMAPSADSSIRRLSDRMNKLLPAAEVVDVLAEQNPEED